MERSGQHRQVFFCVLSTLVLFIACSAYAGDERSGIAGVSMARTFVASSRGLDAIGTNPANLALGDDNRNVTFTIIPPFGLSFRSDFLNYEIYNDYFTGVDTGGSQRVAKFLTDADKDRILSIFPSGLAETHADIDVRIFGITIHSDYLGSIGLAVTERLALNFDMPRDYARFILFGLDSLGSSYVFTGTDERSWWLREYSLSYARKLPDLQFAKNVVAGITIKYVHGYGYVGTDHYNATFANSRDLDSIGNFIGYTAAGSADFTLIRSGIDAFGEGKTSFTPFPTPAGTGYGVDIGFAAEVFQGVRAAFSVTDIGSITWTLNTKERVGTGRFTITNPTAQEQRDSVENAFKGEERAIGEFSTPLATALHFGGSVQFDETGWTPWLPGRLLLAAEVQQGFNSSPGNTTRPRVSLGMEYRPVGFFPLRTGVSFGGADRFNWAVGFGFDLTYFTLDLGTENIAAVFTPNSFNQFSIGLGMRFKI